MPDAETPRITFGEGYRKPQVDPRTLARLAETAAAQTVEKVGLDTAAATRADTLQTTPDVVD